MNFEDIQSLWTGQVSVPASTPLLAERQRTLLSEFKRRGRLLGYETFCAVFALVLTPLLSIVNYRHLPTLGTPLYWVNAALHLLMLVAGVVLVFRRQQRHGALGRVRISSLREQTEVALANLDAERRDYRWLPWMLGIWSALGIFSILTNAPFHGGSWQAVMLRVGILLGFLGVVGAGFWRHYRNNLLPACARQQEILRQMG